MIRTLYALSVVALVASTAYTAAGAQPNGPRAHAGLGFVLLAALQR